MRTHKCVHIQELLNLCKHATPPKLTNITVTYYPHSTALLLVDKIDNANLNGVLERKHKFEIFRPALIRTHKCVHIQELLNLCKHATPPKLTHITVTHHPHSTALLVWLTRLTRHSWTSLGSCWRFRLLSFFFRNQRHILSVPGREFRAIWRFRCGEIIFGVSDKSTQNCGNISNGSKYKVNISRDVIVFCTACADTQAHQYIFVETMANGPESSLHCRVSVR
jgi:mRNA-degrading endonuclease HigB of HigAB toxin-antitoxin module